MRHEFSSGTAIPQPFSQAPQAATACVIFRKPDAPGTLPRLPIISHNTDSWLVSQSGANCSSIGNSWLIGWSYLEVELPSCVPQITDFTI
jgi:hypothetical protein